MAKAEGRAGMSFPKELVPLADPLSAVQRLLERLDNQGVIIGGVAASLLGQPRLTVDVDAVLLLPVDQVEYVIKLSGEEGLVPRIADADIFAKESRVLLLRHQDSTIKVDISFGLLPFEIEAVERSVIYQAGSLAIRIPTPEDLIIMKAVAHRPKDLEDIKSMIANNQNLDRARIEQVVRGFAQALEMPELWNDIAVYL